MRLEIPGLVVVASALPELVLAFLSWIVLEILAGSGVRVRIGLPSSRAVRGIKISLDAGGRSRQQAPVPIGHRGTTPLTLLTLRLGLRVQGLGVGFKV